MSRTGKLRALPFVLVFLFLLLPAATAFAGPAASFSGPLWYDTHYYFGTGYYADSHETADLDNDGDTDIVVPMYDDGAGAGFARTYLNDGSGTFTESDVTTIAGAEVQLADLDRDGKLDAVASTLWSGHSLTIAKGDGAGNLDVAAYFDIGYIAYYRVADYNDDTIPDILVGTGDFDNVRVYLGNGDFTFALSAVVTDIGYNSWSASAADINRDGKQDFVVANFGSDTLDIRLGDGDGIGFTALPDLPALDQPARTVLADLDRDGVLDLACNYVGGAKVSVWRGDGTGDFVDRRDFTLTHDVNDLRAADVNLDGTLDLVAGGQQTGGYQSEITVLLGDGTGLYPVRVKPSYGDYWAYGLNAIRVADFDGDGRPDVSATHTNSNDSMNVTLLWNTSTIDHSLDLKLDSYNVLFTPWRLDAADMDRDGALDLVVGSLDSGMVKPFFGDGEGAFSGNTTYGGLSGQMLGLSIADADNDGDGDVLTVDQDGLGLFLGDGAGGLTLATRETTSGYNTGEFIDANRDGDLDVVTPALDAAVLTRVWAGAGDGSLTASGTFDAGAWNNCAGVADFNGDGVQDVATVGNGNIHVSFGDGIGGFTTTTGAMVAPFSTMQMAAGDIDANGTTDLVVATNYMQPLFNDGAGSFTLGTIVNVPSRCITLADFDLDGTLDVAVGGADGHIRYLSNNGSGTFTQVADVDTTFGMALHTMVSGDFDRDGRPDVATVGGGRLFVVTNDVIPPFTTVQIAPATYDGENGWYDTTPTVTFTTNESAETSYSLNGGPWTVFDGSGIGEIAPGMNTVTYRSADTAGNLEDQQWFSFAVDTGKPVTTAIGLPGGTSSTAVTFTLEATDTASGVGNTYYSLNGGTTQTYGGEVTLDEEGSWTVRFWSVDIAGNVETENVADVVIDLPDPAVTSPDAYETDEDAALTIFAPGVLGNDTDPEGGTLTAVVVDQPANGDVTLDPDGAFVYTPDSDWNGTDEFTYAALNVAGASTAETVTITVNAVNDPPASIALSNDTIDENEPAGSVVGTFTTDDVDSTDFTYSLPAGFDDNDLFTIEGNELKAGEAFDYEVAGSHWVWVCSSDQLGAYTYSAFVIYVGDVDEPPVTAPDEYTTSEDTTLTVLDPGVLGNDSDPLGGIVPTGIRPLAPALGMWATVLDEPSNGTLTFAPEGGFEYVPDDDWNGTDEFTYVATNDEGSSAVQTVTITVDAVNDAPTGISLSNGTVDENEPADTLVGVLSADDVDATTLTYSILPGDDGSAFTISGDELHAAASFDFETKSSYLVHLRVTDDGDATYDADFTIGVTDVDEVPIAVPDSYATTEGVTLTVGAPGWLGNDSDAEGATLRPYTVTLPSSGSLVYLNTDGSFEYAPGAGFHGTETFLYRVYDGVNYSDPASVTITVAALDSRPPTTTSDAQESYAGIARITLSATDDVTGVYQTYFKLDDAPVIASTLVNVVTTGEHTLEFWSKDWADNVEPSHVVTFTVTSDVIPISGDNRYDTALKASQEAFDGVEGSGWAVIARGNGWADAMAGASLAGAVRGPLLLTPTDALASAIPAELERLSVTDVYILGDRNAISDGVAGQLATLLGGSEHVHRVAGPNRYATASAIASETVRLLGQSFTGDVFIATGRNWPDAVSASALSAGLGRPVLLSKPDTLSPDARDAITTLGVQRAILLGSTKALSAEVEDGVVSLLGTEDVDRLEGVNRYETALEVARYGLDHGFSLNGLAIGSGINYPDVLSGGVMQGSFRSVVLITPPTRLYPGVRDMLSANKRDIGFVRILGGPAAVTEPVRVEISHALE